MEKKGKVITVAIMFASLFYSVNVHCFFHNQQQQQQQLNKHIFCMLNIIAIPLAFVTFIGAYDIGGFGVKDSFEAAFSVFSGMYIFTGYEYLRYCAQREQEQNNNQNFIVINDARDRCHRNVGL